MHVGERKVSVLVGSGLDVNAIIISFIPTIPALVAAWLAYRTHERVRTPSGDTIGTVVEKTHDLAAADLAMTTQVHKTITNGEDM